MDSARQKKVNALLRAVVSEIVLNKFRASGYKNHVVSVTGVRISADLSVARVSVSVYPFSSSVMVIQLLKSSKSSIKKDLSKKDQDRKKVAKEISEKINNKTLAVFIILDGLLS